MSKEIYISSTPHETRLAIVESDALTEIYYERENEYTLAGSIYNGKVTRVLPGMQSSFVDIGLERDAFLYITDFMEEAGDSADFEASAGNGRSPRTEPRQDGGGNRDRGPRPERNRDRNQDRQPQRAALPAAEPTDEELFTAAVSNLDESANSSSERPERSGGNRGRGGRNRNRRPDANRTDQPRTDQPRPAAAAPIVPEEQTSFMQPSGTSDSEEVGEGAPGADGSRRWRGRRGRRGGRGPGFVPARDAAAPAAPVASAPALEPEVEAHTDIYAAEAPATPTRAERPAQDRGNQDRPNQDRGNRNDRDRGRGRGDRGDRAPRTPFAGEPEVPVYGREVYAEAPTEPIILPGESLSKYRPGSETTASPASATPVPSTEFKLAAGWDGGFVLPGESLSRRRGPETRKSESRPAQASYKSVPPVEHFVAPLAEAAEPMQAAAYATPEVVPFGETAVEAVPVAESAPVVEAVPEPPAIKEISEPEPVQEYEPSEASASYRLDPVAPREYRQAAPVLELEPEPVAEPEAHIPEFTSIAATGEMHSEPIAEPAAPVTHDLDPSGHIALDHTSSPILSETAIVSEPTHSETVEFHSEAPVELIEAGTESHGFTHTTSVPPPPAPTQNFGHFEPGTGDLEEEELDDEEFDLPSLQARASHDADLDDSDQETLEGAADLGTMLREMSIDDITGPADDEEDDLEEDFLEEDQELGYDVDDEAPSEDELDELDELEDSEDAESDHDTEMSGQSPELASTDAAPARTEPKRDHPRRDGRRDGRGRGDRNRPGRSGSSSSEGGSERSGSGDRGRRDGRGGRPSAQMTNLPAISDLLKPGQEILVQIAKEPIAKKGARITSHIALPGRFLVFMPTVGHTGVSRKIESDQERRRLKEILLSERGDASGGFIVRTAAEGASEDELRSDLRFLLNLWTDIKNRSESSKSPALIYHDLNLVERVLRDQVTDNFSAIWVDTESQYEQVLRFLQRFQPSLIRRVKLYTKETPLFEQFGITEEINKALRSKVWLKSGGSIVINQTEALVAIDINTGKYVGKTARLEDTIVKTNLDAIPEIVRQIRLRDLGGIIIIDFIDMDERKNRNKVMAALEEELKSDRAPSKVLQFNDFGLVAITRKRVKQSLERTLSTTCGVCAGTGMVKSPITVCNDIYVEMRKMHKHLDRGDVMLRVHPEVVKQLKSPATHWLQEMEEMCGKTILVKSDPSLHPEQFDIH